MQVTSRLGLVTAARREAADAGASMIAAGGTAADAAVATAFALTVADPMNCGIGGYGGAALVLPAKGRAPVQVDFATAAPAALEDEALTAAPRHGGFVSGPLAVTRPAVVPGLASLHAEFGRLSWPDVLAPAIKLAREGFAAGPDLVRALRWAERAGGLFTTDFWQVFGALGAAPDETYRLTLPDLADSLDEIATGGPAVMTRGRLAQAIARSVQDAGGVLSEGDLAYDDVSSEPPEFVRYAGCEIYGPRAETSGFGVLASALDAVGSAPWPHTRDASYIKRAADGLRQAWRARAERARGIVAASQSIQHTTHLCAADGEGGMVSLTFTHGPLWFGSGVLVPGTGILLNCGANLLVRDTTTRRRFAQTNLSPVIARGADGSWFALGTPGGHRIPAVVMTALIDVATTGASIEEAIARPRLAVKTGGGLEVEAGLEAFAPGAGAMKPADFYGPASGIAAPASGGLIGARDPRFSGAVATVEAVRGVPGF